VGVIPDNLGFPDFVASTFNIAMGCILPLSENEDLPDQFGTRHRAALGLSELTDAVCLVVSEERSEVVSVVGGKIASWQQPESLQEKLDEWLGGPQIHVPTIQRFLEDFFIKNWKQKLTALALVSTAWLFLASQQEIEINFSAPVRFENAAAEIPEGQGAMKAVNLTISGRPRQIKVIEPDEVVVRVNLNGLGAGKHKIRLTGKNVDLPSGVKVEQFIPQSIEITVPANPSN
jgi:hypothetical protein